MRPLLLVLLLGVPAAAQPTATLTPLPLDFQPLGVSADGTVVVGQCVEAFPSLPEACLWRDGALTRLGFLEADPRESIAYGVSPDGTVVVGNSRSQTGGISRTLAFRWTAATGMVALESSQPANPGSTARAVSGTGRIVGGEGPNGLVWDGPGPPSFLTAGGPTAITPDGLTILGITLDAGLPNRAFRLRDGVRALVPLADDVDSYVTGRSDDGAIVVGGSRVLGSPRHRPFRWEGGAAAILPTLPGYETDRTAVESVSGDGTTAVGYADLDGVTAAVLWQGTTPRRLLDVLVEDFGLDVPGLELSTGELISANGRTLIAFGRIGVLFQSYLIRLSGSDRRWVDAGGGAFDEPDNWDPQGAPGDSESARFDLDATYTVTGATTLAGGDDPLVRVRRFVIDAGTVDFSGVRFSVPDESPEAPGLSVRFGGTARVVADTAFAALVSVGQEALPAGDPRVARLQVFNAGTRLGTTSVAVGDAGPGELFVGVGGRLDSQTGYVGLSAAGEAIVGGAGSAWAVADLEVGGQARGVLRVEAGGRVETDRTAVGATAGSEPSLVELTGTTPAGASSVLDVFERLTVGLESGGRIEVRDGGLLDVGNDRIDVGADGPGEGALDLFGGSAGGVTSRAVARHLRIAVAPPGDASPRDGGVGVTGGAFLRTDSLTIGAADGGTALLVVSGADAAGRVSNVLVGVSLVESPGPIRVGERGRGEVLLVGGGDLRGGDLRLGATSTVQVLGTSADGEPSALTTVGVRVGAGPTSEESDRADLFVGDGGLVVTEELGVGVSGGSGLSRVTVSGRGPAERSLLDVFDVLGDDTRGRCLFGVISPAEVVVEGGGRLLCHRAEIGGPGAPTDVFVADSASAFVVERTLIVGAASGDAGVLRFDGFGVADAVGTGVVSDSHDVVVRATGRVLGQGIVIGSTLVEEGGELAPGVFVDGDVERSGGDRYGGTLTLRGRLDAASGAVLVVPVASADSTRQGRLRVHGRATLGGTLRLDFRDGHAPVTGDVLTPIVADTLGGAFEAVEVTGLAPGWTYTVATADGQFVVTSLSDGVATSPVDGEPAAPGGGGLALHAPAPNPAGGTATVVFDLPAPSAVRLDVLDALGRTVAVLLDGERSAGAHALSLDVSRLAPGVYTLRLVAGDAAVARRVTVVR